MQRRGLHLIWLMLLLGVLIGTGAVTAYGGARVEIADGVRGVQPTSIRQ